MARGDFSARFPARDTAPARALAGNVRRLRKERGMSQDELADAVGIQTAAISHIENRRGNPTLVTLESLAAVLGVRFADLFRSR
jgi:transcriptional regulator with XRE-family HTH domain